MGSNPAGRAKDQLLKAVFQRPHFLLQEFARRFSLRHSQQCDQLIEQPAIGPFDELGWQTVSAMEDVLGPGRRR